MTKQSQPDVFHEPIADAPLKALHELFEARDLTNCFLDLAEEHLSFEDFKMARYVCEQLRDSLADKVKAKLPERAAVLNLDNRVCRDFVSEATAVLIEALPAKQSN